MQANRGERAAPSSNVEGARCGRVKLRAESDSRQEPLSSNVESAPRCPVCLQGFQVQYAHMWWCCDLTWPLRHQYTLPTELLPTAGDLRTLLYNRGIAPTPLQERLMPPPLRVDMVT